MNMLEAMEQSFNFNKVNDADELWFRPVSWKGCRQAFVVDISDMRTYVVPSQKGGIVHMTPNMSELVGEWEVVDADEVLMEKYR